MLSRIAAIQMNSTNNVLENLKRAGELIAEAAKKQAAVIILPEMFAIMGKQDIDKVNCREVLGKGVIQDFLSKQAKEHGVWLVGGTIPIACDNPNKIRAACLVFNAEGERVARYDKIHLFDVSVGEKVYKESAATEAGQEVVVVDTPVGKMGLAVCYDLRFPEFCGELMRRGAEVIAVPTAFTEETGRAHWDLLTRMRAVENWCYVVGSCQTGVHASGRSTFGHSVIVEPWGKVVSCLPKEVGSITADIDLNYLQSCRNNIPSLTLRQNNYPFLSNKIVEPTEEPSIRPGFFT